MNKLIASLLQLYAQKIGLNLSPTEQVTFNEVVSATGLSRKVTHVIVRELMRHHVLEASLKGEAFTDRHLADFELLDQVFGTKPNWFGWLKFRLIVAAKVRAQQEVYWPQYETYGRASA